MKWNRNNKFQAVLYWFLNCTWGIVMTLIGAVVAFALIITGHKPKRFGWDIYFNVGEWWGGVEFGPFFLTDKKDSYHTKCHEHGHGFQNALIGPFFPFVVGIPSSIRYWLRENETYKGKKIFCGVLISILLLVSFAIIGLGMAFYPPVQWLGLAILAYFTILSMWLLDELDKHKEKDPPYDDFYPEGNATKTGTEFMKED